MGDDAALPGGASVADARTCGADCGSDDALAIEHRQTGGTTIINADSGIIENDRQRRPGNRLRSQAAEQRAVRCRDHHSTLVFSR